MNSTYPRLFQRGKIGRLDIPNRIVREPMGTYLCNPDGSASERQIRTYQEAATGGVGLVFMDNAAVLKERHMGVCAAGDEYIPGLCQLAEAITDQGARAGLQLAHPGRDGVFVGGAGVKAASRAQFEPWYQYGFPVPQELTIEEIHEINSAFGDAARRAKVAGFDMVDIHAASGTLPCNFLSPAQNVRNDIYGGSLYNRMRFLIELVRDVKQKTGDDFPLSVRLSLIDYEPNSIELEESLEVCKALEENGVDAINALGGSHAEQIHAAPSMLSDHAIHVPAAAAVKELVKIPVMVCGSIHTPELAEEILEAGKADFIGLGRPFLADSHWAEKAKEGRAEDIRPCIRCNYGCHDKGILPGRIIECAVNPTLYKHDTLAVTKAAKSKKVAVIGGGPAGMEAALVSVKRGHDVTLYEKRELGGVLKEASEPEFKSDIRRLVDYYKTQVKKADVKVVGEEATLDTIKNGDFDAAIVAVGATVKKLDVRGIDNPIVMHALDALNGKSEVGQQVIIVGGGVTGAETGLALAEQGKDVTFVEMQDAFLPTLGMNRPAYLERLFAQNVRAITGHRVDEVLDGAAIIVDRWGKKEQLPADSVVIASGFAPQTALREQLEAETDVDVYAVGDCVGPRMIYEAVHEGYMSARRI